MKSFFFIILTEKKDLLIKHTFGRVKRFFYSLMQLVWIWTFPSPLNTKHRLIQLRDLPFCLFFNKSISI